MTLEIIEVSNAVESFVDNPNWPRNMPPVEGVLTELYGCYFEKVKARQDLSALQLTRLSNTISKSEQLFSFSLRGSKLPTSTAIDIIKRQSAMALGINYNSTLDQFIMEVTLQGLYKEEAFLAPFLRCFSQMVHFETLSKTGSLPATKQIHFQGLITPSWKP